MVFLRCLIVCLGGGDFGIEAAEEDGFAVITDVSDPFVVVGVEGDADVTRRGFLSCFSPVEHIFGGSGEAEVCFSIIEAVAISVVNEEAGRRFHNERVHIERFNFAFADSDRADGVEGVITFGGTPFDGVEEGVDIGVNDGEFELSQGDDADVAAEANAMIGLDGPKQNFFEV